MLAAGLIAITLTLQVPPPNAAAKASESLRLEQRAILDREARELNTLAKTLTAGGNVDAAAEVRRLLPPPPLADGGTRFNPLPEVVRRRTAGLASVPAGSTGKRWPSELAAIRTVAATGLFDLANRAAGSLPKRYAFADSCLRGVLERQPDHPETRRLLGYVPHDGGWATPFAVQRLSERKVLHPKFGWVQETWLPHLEKGELPAPKSAGKGETWLPADEADALRRDSRPPWTIDTEHFSIQTNVPLSEAIAFGRHLEAFHDLFYSMLADVLGEKIPLALRFRKAVVPAKPLQHKVYYYASRDEFIEAVRPFQGKDAEVCLGVYVPPKPGKSRAPAYFFRDKDGELDVTATLYHEVSHQLLFEGGSAALTSYLKNAGQFWVFEGMGTYFESIVTRSDGSIEVGGKVGRRIEAAVDTIVRKQKVVPLKDFVRFDQARFLDPDDVYQHYQQADALATYLMDGHDGEYRESFLEYFRDAYHGALKPNTPRSLEFRVGKTYTELQAELTTYLGQVQTGK